MRYLLLILVLWLVATGRPAQATHIVGGEFSLEYVSGINYALTLNIYFDDINGSVGAEDANVIAHVFRKSTNTWVTTYTLPKVSRTGFVSNTAPACTIPQLRTRVIVYRAIVPFDTIETAANQDPEGYYIVHERCCRNGGIVNLQNPGATGQTFYTEVPPPRTIANSAFINSTPVFRQPRNDYVCIGQPFELDYSATDADGDQLVYSLEVPLMGNSNTVEPRPTVPVPGPYMTVFWASGYGPSNQINGPFPLQIDPVTGRLSVTASAPLGLHVFAVKVEEYRNGRRLGEVRREYQLLVRDCPPNSPPNIVVQNPVTDRLLARGDTLTIGGDFDACMNVRVNSLFVGAQANKVVTLTAIAVNFQPREPLLPNNNQLVLSSPTDTVSLAICLPKCSLLVNQSLLHVRLHAVDNSCPQALTDSTDLYVRIQKPPLQRPLIFVGGQQQTSESVVRREVTVNQPEDLILEARDSSDQLVRVRVNEVYPQPRVEAITPYKASKQRYVFPLPTNCDDAPPGDSIVYKVLADRVFCDTMTRDSSFIVVKRRFINEPIAVSTSLEQGPTLQRLYAFSLPRLRDTTFTIAVNNPDAFGTLTTSISGIGAPGVSVIPQRTSNNSLYRVRVEANCEAMYQPQPYRIVMRAREIYCSDTLQDSLTVAIFLQDYEEPEFKAGNVLTPNGDGYNDAFVLSQIVPLENCTPDYVRLRITNRWGQDVFTSNRTDFHWTAPGAEAGVYFYHLQLNQRTYKGWIQLLR